MAKSKKKTIETINTWRYRLKNAHNKKTGVSPWSECDDDGKAKIESMYRYHYEFEQIEGLEPTKNMIVEEEKKD